MNVIETSGLGKCYGHTWALRECTLAVPAGHLAALVGPNGAGKTTLMNMCGRPDRPDRRDRHRARRPGRRVAGRAGRHRVRRAGRAGVHEPVRRGHAAPDQEPEPALRPALRAGPAGRARHPAEEEGRQAVRRPAGPARADPGAGPAAAAAHPRRTAGDARPAGPAGLHGHGDDRDGRRRRVGACCPRTRSPSWSGSPTTSSCCPAASCRSPARSTTCSPATAC